MLPCEFEDLKLSDKISKHVVRLHVICSARARAQVIRVRRDGFGKRCLSPK